MRSLESEQPRVEALRSQKQLNPNHIRDHLANERTYLAWMRSAIALIGFGVIIVRLRIQRPPVSFGNGWKLGLLFNLCG
jgi:putative membrane protein